MVEFFLRDLFVSLNERELGYCVWGNHEGLPNSLRGSDLDIVIRRSEKEDFSKILKKTICKLNGQIVSYFDTENTRHYRIAGTYDNEGWGIMIDIMFDDLYYKGKVYIPSKWILRFQTKHNGINVNELGFSFITGFLKELLHNGKVKDKYLNNTCEVLQEDSETYKNFIIDVYGVKFFNQLLSEIIKPKSELNLKLLRKEAQAGIGSSQFGRIVNNLKKIDRLFKSSPGFTISVIGTDGSGKSTIIEAIRPTLDAAFHGAVYYEHMRPNNLPSLAVLLGNEKDDKNGVPVTKPHSKETSGFIGSLMRWGFYMLDYTFGYALKIWPKKAIRSCVWIFDRYYYDYLIDPKRTRVQLPKWLLKFGQYIIPEPDIILCLGTDPETIHRRKPELTLNEVKRQVSDLQIFSNNHPRAIWIDTGQNLEKSSEDALSSIIRLMAKRFEHVDFQA